MKTFFKNHKKLVLIVGLLALIIAANEAWSTSAGRRGRWAAQAELRRGNYTFLTFGLEPPERRVISRLLRERYGIELRTVAGDIVSRELVAYVRSYNEVMDEAITSKFGHDVYKECAEDAKKLVLRAPL